MLTELSDSNSGTHDLETNFVLKASLVRSRESMCFSISSGNTFIMSVDCGGVDIIQVLFGYIFVSPKR